MTYRNLTPGQRRQQDKYYREMKKLGRSQLVPGQPVREHILKLEAMGMGIPRIAELSGIHRHRLGAIVRGIGHHGQPLRNVRRTTAEAVLAVTYEAPTRFGARIPAHGARRRLQAFRADGFPLRVVGDLVGYDRSALWDICAGREAHAYIYQRTHNMIADAYDKHAGARPEDFDVLAGNAKRVRTYAVKHGFAPRHCWDDDTIDDVNAFPEWTGACGSENGYRLHLKHTIPLCQPCIDGRNEARRHRDRLPAP